MLLRKGSSSNTLSSVIIAFFQRYAIHLAIIKFSANTRTFKRKTKKKKKKN